MAREPKKFRFRWFILLLPILSLTAIGCSPDKPTVEEPTKSPVGSPEEAGQISSSELTLGDSQVRPADGMVMLYVPPGEFEMGSQDGEVNLALEICREYDTNCSLRYFSIERPAHIVDLDGYWIDKTEVSNTQYTKCIEAGYCTEVGCPELLIEAEHPVVCITWDQAEAYCEWAGGRLPTEAEWEYAARGADGLRFPWGDDFDGRRLNYCDSNCELGKKDETVDDGYVETAPVGNYPEGASWTGALDMAGNVWEWTADYYGPYSEERQVNPSGPSTGGRRVVRGGSWHTTPDHVRSALRTYSGPNQEIDHVGFRCASSPR